MPMAAENADALDPLAARTLRWRPPSRSWLSRVPPASAFRSRSACNARTLLYPGVPRGPLLPFVPHVSPQPVHLSLAHLVVAHQRLFDGFAVAGSLAQPPEDGVLLKALRPREATDPDPLGQ